MLERPVDDAEKRNKEGENAKTDIDLILGVDGGSRGGCCCSGCSPSGHGAATVGAERSLVGNFFSTFGAVFHSCPPCRIELVDNYSIQRFSGFVNLCRAFFRLLGECKKAPKRVLFYLIFFAHIGDAVEQ